MRYCEEVTASDSLSVGFVPGVTPDKWFGRWRERNPRVPLDGFEVDADRQLEILCLGQADLSFVRLPADALDAHIIPLYVEQPVIVAAQHHEIALFDTVDVTQIDEPFLDPATVGGEAMAIELAASGAGLVIVPMSIARRYSRKDAVFRPISGVAETRIALAWLVANDSELIEEFVGIVRGRTANSSRQPSARAATPGSSPTALSNRRSAAAKPVERKPAGSGRKARNRGRGGGHR